MYIHVTNWNCWKLSTLASVPADFMSCNWKIVMKARPSVSDTQALSCLSIWAVCPSAHLFLLFLFDFSSAVLWFLSNFLHLDPSPCKTVSPRICINVSQYPRNTFMDTEEQSKVLPQHADCPFSLSCLPQNKEKKWNFYYFPEKNPVPTITLFLSPHSLSGFDTFLF